MGKRLHWAKMLKPIDEISAEMKVRIAYSMIRAR